METERFELTLFLHPDGAISLWEREAGAVYQKTNVYVDAVVVPATYLCREEGGSAASFHQAAMVAGVRDPKVHERAQWHNAVCAVILAVTRASGQKNVSVVFSSVNRCPIKSQEDT